MLSSVADPGAEPFISRRAYPGHMRTALRCQLKQPCVAEAILRWLHLQRICSQFSRAGFISARTGAIQRGSGGSWSPLFRCIPSAHTITNEYGDFSGVVAVTPYECPGNRLGETVYRSAIWLPSKPCADRAR